MRQAIIISPGVGYILGTLGTTSSAAQHLVDRQADDGHYPHERVVRLPRRAGYGGCLPWRQSVGGELVCDRFYRD